MRTERTELRGWRGSRIRPWLVLLLCLPLSLWADNPQRQQLTREQWGNAASGREVTAIKPLQDMVKQLLEAPDTRLFVLYPGDDQGIKWATQVVEWLTALGVASARVQMTAVSADVEVIELEVRSSGKQ